MKSFIIQNKEIGVLSLIILIIFGVLLKNIDNTIGITLIVVIIPCLFFIFIIKKSEKYFYKVLMWIPFILTAQMISVGSYRFNIYYFTSIITVLLLLNIKILTNKTLQNLFFLLFSLFFSGVLSYKPIDALASSVYLFLNMLGSFSFYLLIQQKKIELDKIQKFIYYILLVNICFSIFQFILYKITGIPIGLGKDFGWQLGISQIPGFRVEANTHGKLVCFSILYCIPPLIRNYKIKDYKNLMGLSLIVAILSPTRSASYAMILTIGVFVIRYIYLKKNKNLIKYILILIFFGSILLIFFSLDIIELGGYSAIKFQNFFLINKQKLLKDGSAGYRLGSMSAALNIWNQNFKTKLIGVGYGQAYADIKGTEGLVRVGGNDILLILTGGGIIGLLFYLNIYFYQIKILIKKYKIFKCKSMRILIEQLIISIIYFFFVGITSGVLSTPEIWMIFGISAYVNSLKFKRRISAK